MHIGIDVGGTNLVAGVIDNEHRIIARARRKTADSVSAEALCDELVLLAREVVDNAGMSLDEIEDVGIGFPGSVDRRKGVVLYTPNAPFLNTSIRDWFRKSWDVPVYVGNDAGIIGAALLGRVQIKGGRC